MDVVPLAPAHIESAARLFTATYRRQREAIPSLPARHEFSDGVFRLIADLAERVPGVVALEEGEVRGYLIGLPIPSFFGNHKGVLVPIWGHAVLGNGRIRLYRALYASLAAKWVDAGYLAHAITVYADDVDAREAFFWDCFGLQVVDALGPATAVRTDPPAGVEVRRATIDDAVAVVPLSEGLYRHVASSPILFPLFSLPSADRWSEWLSKDDHVLWLAFTGGEAIGYIRLEPRTYDLTYVVHDPQTIAISGAFVLPEWRRRGVAESVLSSAVAWAREAGYQRVSVDFEAANHLACGFWLQYFQPICHSLLRKVNERNLWARPDLPADRLW